MPKKKPTRPQLSLNQLEQLVSIAVRNNLDIVGEEFDDGYQFVIMLDCLDPEGCIPHDQEPEDDEETWGILEAHGVAELAGFINNIMGLSREGEFMRAVETGIIDSSNIEEFLSTLDAISNYWDDIAENNEPDLKNKNVVAGNGTLN